MIPCRSFFTISKTLILGVFEVQEQPISQWDPETFEGLPLTQTTCFDTIVKKKTTIDNLSAVDESN